ncbi:MAG: hypothetical protein D6814_10045 [Calditrichaeota bacterium]|nr:MAG: hypothetical protein D6814_10045 [Calditrichota bacterium]
MTDFSRLPIPFVCLATDIVTGKPVALRHGDLPLALRASMAIPTIFSPVKIDDHLLVDGGLVRNLPAQDARDLGAEVVIGVDVGSPLRSADRLNSFIEIMDQSMSLQAAASTAEQRKLCDLLIIPELQDLNFADFDQAFEFVQRGERAARKLLPQLIALRDSVLAQNHASESPSASVAKIDSIFIVNIQVDGLHQVSRGFVLSQLNIHAPAWVTPTELAHAIEHVYSSQFFHRVTYRLTPETGGTRLIVEVLEKNADLLHFSIQYNSQRKTTLLLNGTFRNLTGHSSTLAIDLNLGGKGEISGEYYVHTGLLYGLGAHFQLAYADSLLDVYADQVQEARFHIRSLWGQAELGTFFSSSILFATGFKLESTRAVLDIGTPGLAPLSGAAASLMARLWFDTRDRRYFPDSGTFLQLQGQAAFPTRGSQVRFQRYLFDWQAFAKLGQHFSLLTRLQAGYIKQKHFPIYYKFYLGGETSFVGLNFQEAAAPFMQALQLGLMYEVFAKRYLILRWNLGEAAERWQWPSFDRNYIFGVGLTAGAMTPIGPFEFTLAGGNRHTLLTYLNFGFKF